MLTLVSNAIPRDVLVQLVEDYHNGLDPDYDAVERYIAEGVIEVLQDKLPDILFWMAGLFPIAT